MIGRASIRKVLHMRDAARTEKVTLTREQIELLEEHGMAPPAPHRSTRLRRQARWGRLFPVISRSGRTYKDDDGRPFGEVDSAQQCQADARYWGVGAAVRAALEPMTVSVGGTVKRIREVTAWTQCPESGKWIASFGRTFESAEDNAALDLLYPDYPYRIGDDCPTRQGGAYWPESY